MQKKRCYEYLNVCYSLEADDKLDCLFLPLLNDYYIETQEDKDLDFSVMLCEEKYKNIAEILEFGSQLLIHNSKKPAVHEKGISYENGYMTSIYNLTTKSVYSVNRLTKRITIYNKDVVALTKDAVRVIRDLIKTIVEHKNKAMMLHAAALKSPQNYGVLLIGGKGSGKTTISLKLLYEHGFTEISRDRVFLVDDNEKVHLFGWPNYYNLTLRTMKEFPVLQELIPPKYCNLKNEMIETIGEKLQYLPDALEITQKETRCELTHVLFLNNLNAKSEQEAWEILAESCYSPEDLNYKCWHKWFSEDSYIKEQAIQMSYKVMESKNIKTINWKTIDEGVNDIVEYLKLQ